MVLSVRLTYAGGATHSQGPRLLPRLFPTFREHLPLVWSPLLLLLWHDLYQSSPARLELGQGSGRLLQARLTPRHQKLDFRHWRPQPARYRVLYEARLQLLQHLQRHFAGCRQSLRLGSPGRQSQGRWTCR